MAKYFTLYKFKIFSPRKLASIQVHNANGDKCPVLDVLQFIKQAKNIYLI